MIEVTIYKKANKYKGFKLSGHAGYSKSGTDIICAAVSVLTINTINSIETFTDDGFTWESNEKKGIIEFDFDSEVCEKSELLMDSFILGLKGVKEGNEKYIKIDYKEV